MLTLMLILLYFVFELFKIEDGEEDEQRTQCGHIEQYERIKCLNVNKELNYAFISQLSFAIFCVTFADVVG